MKKYFFAITIILLLCVKSVWAQDKADCETPKNAVILKEFRHITPMDKKSFEWVITYDEVASEIKSVKVTTISSEPR